MSNLNSFEAQLLDNLKTQQPVRSHTVRNRTIALSGGIAVAAVSGALAVSTLSATPAFAVEKNSTGDIHVVIHSLTDAAGLQTELAKQGVNAKVSYDEPNVVRLPDLPSDAPVPIPAQPDANGGSSVSVGVDKNDNITTSEEDAAKGAAAYAKDCDSNPAATPRLEIQQDKAIIDIPKGTFPTNRDLAITTSGNSKSVGTLTLSWTSASGYACGLGLATAGQQGQ